MLRVLGLIGLVMIAGFASAQTDGIRSEGLLSDDDLYRMITCGAAPGALCTGPVVRWNRAELTVAFEDDTKGVNPEKTSLISRSLDQAIAALNQTGANLRLTRLDGATADITLRHVTLQEGGSTRDIPGFPDGLSIGVGHMWLSWDSSAHIENASILISIGIAETEVRSVVLEEMTQSLGFLFDIENPYYEGISILSQDSNETISIVGQDRAMLRRHYP
jgi:Protein of unknown function (DUF2927)